MGRSLGEPSIPVIAPGSRIRTRTGKRFSRIRNSDVGAEAMAPRARKQPDPKSRDSDHCRVLPPVRQGEVGSVAGVDASAFLHWSHRWRLFDPDFHVWLTGVGYVANINGTSAANRNAGRRRLERKGIPMTLPA